MQEFIRVSLEASKTYPYSFRISSEQQKLLPHCIGNTKSSTHSKHVKEYILMIWGYKYESFNDLCIFVAPFLSLIFFTTKKYKLITISKHTPFLVTDSIQRKMVRRKIWEKDL